MLKVQGKITDAVIENMMAQPMEPRDASTGATVASTSIAASPSGPTTPGPWKTCRVTFGFHVDNLLVDYGEAQSRSRTVVSRQTRKIAILMKNHGIAVYEGAGGSRAPGRWRLSLPVTY